MDTLKAKEPYLDSRIFKALFSAFLSNDSGMKKLELTDGLNSIIVEGNDIVLSTYTRCDDKSTSRFLVQKLKQIVKAVSNSLGVYRTPWSAKKYSTYIRRCREKCHGDKPLDIVITSTITPESSRELVRVEEDEDLNAAMLRINGPVYAEDYQCVLSNIIIHLADGEKCDAFNEIFKNKGLLETIARFAFIAEPAYINAKINYWDGHAQRATLENKLTFSRFASLGGKRRRRSKSTRRRSRSKK